MRIQSMAVAVGVGVSSVAFAQTGLTVEWTWKRSHQCSATSPPMTVAGIPADAKSLEIRMVDLGFTQFNHGGGTVAHSGEPIASIPGGALQSYKGPCPMRNLYYGSDYEFLVRAIAADGKTVLAQGSAMKTYSTSVVKE